MGSSEFTFGNERLQTVNFSRNTSLIRFAQAHAWLRNPKKLHAKKEVRAKTGNVYALISS